MGIPNILINLNNLSEGFFSEFFSSHAGVKFVNKVEGYVETIKTWNPPDRVEIKKMSLDLASNSSGVLMIPIPKEGIFKGLKNIDKAEAIEEIVNIELSLPIGTYVKKPPFTERYLGFVFANGMTNSVTKEALMQCDKILDPIIE